MNSFQAQFNSLLGIALGAKKLGTPSKPLGTPTAPAPTPKSSTFMEDTELGYDPYGFSNAYQTSSASMDPEMERAYYARQRSIQNLKNRHTALRTIKLARSKKGEFLNPLGSRTIMSHDKGGNI